MTEEVKKIESAACIKYGSREQKDIWRKLFIESEDPTGYAFAEQYVEGGYRRWLRIIAGTEYKNEIKEWYETQSIRIQSKSILNIASQRDSFQANRWLADRGWVEKSDKRTKEAKKKASELHDHLRSDMERLGLKVV